MPSRKSKKFVLKDEDVDVLAGKLRCGELGTRSYRGMILLLKHYEHPNKNIAELLNISPKTVVNICQNYLKNGLKRSLTDLNRSGRPVLFDEKTAKQIINIVKSDPPDTHKRWTLKLIHDLLVKNGIVKNISKEKIRIILKENGFAIRTKT